jgi:geranylgeranyl diphosphate synthase type I
MTARSAAEVLTWSRDLVEPAMRAAIDTLDDPARHIAGYHMGWWDTQGRPTRAGGKALRPALALLSAEAVGGTASQAIPAAAAVELVHNFSLVHDDIMDGDTTRRHRPTAWHVFGTGPAVLTGDLLLMLAVDVLTMAGGPARVLTRAILELLDGQNTDLAFERRTDVSPAECEAMAVAKTAALLRCSCTLGALLGGATAEQAARLGEFGELIGLAFQHADDLLGIWGDPATTGKPAHSDLVNRKKSLPVVAALASGGPAGHELATRYLTDTDLDPAQTAALVEAAGGRRRSQDQIARLLDRALTALRRAVPAGRATAELTALGHLAAHRSR